MSYFSTWQSPEQRIQATIWQAAQASSPPHRFRRKPTPQLSTALTTEHLSVLQEMLWLALQARSGAKRMHFYQVYHILNLFRRASSSRLHWFAALRTFRFKQKLEVVFPDLLLTLAEFQGKSDTPLDVDVLRKCRDDLLGYVAVLKDGTNVQTQLRAAYATMSL